MGGVVQSTDKADTETNWPGTDASADHVFEGADLGGLTPAQVNASDFGVVIAASSAIGGTAQIDHLPITVEWIHDKPNWRKRGYL